MPIPTNGRFGSGAFRAYSDPDAQEIEAPTANSIPTSGIEPLADVPTSSAAPANPITRPSATRGVGRRPSTPSISAIHSGISAMISATIPEGTVRSAQTTAPFPPSSSAPPMIAAAAHCRRPGRSASASPRPIVNANMSPPATRKRTDAASSAGSVWFTIRIAKYVVPQTMYTVTSAAHTAGVVGRPRSSEVTPWEVAWDVASSGVASGVAGIA
jgi:hypothetical protein